MSRRYFLALLLAAAVVAGFLFYYHSMRAPVRDNLVTSRTITLDGKAMRIAVADTEASRERGLGGVRSLEDDEGMLFVFGEDGIYPFWMKDMLISIDMLWISSDGKVVYIAKDVAPDTYPQAFTPDSPARYVLEVRAGFSDQHDIRIGSMASI